MVSVYNMCAKRTIFASTLDSAEGYSLVGCMCQPGFEYEHFELLTQEYLIRQYPQYESIIKISYISRRLIEYIIV